MRALFKIITIIGLLLKKEKTNNIMKMRMIGQRTNILKIKRELSEKRERERERELAYIPYSL